MPKPRRGVQNGPQGPNRGAVTGVQGPTQAKSRAPDRPTRSEPTSYASTLKRLYALQARGIKLNLERIERALELCGHPERDTACVHVAGTNGKGSVAVMLAQMLSSAGLRTGLFTSPHLHRFTERIRVDGSPIPEQDVAQRFSHLHAVLARHDGPRLTFFEWTTLMAFEYFRDQGCEIAVLEVGLGGRLDATNTAHSRLSVITRIALDHTNILGDTLPAIAREKAGIIKPGVPLVHGVTDRGAREVIERRAGDVGAPVVRLGRDFGSERAPDGSFAVWTRARRVPNLRSGLRGEHQIDNAACAVTAALEIGNRGPGFRDAWLRGGLQATRWPGRMELVEAAPNVLFDAAHNPDACVALARFLRSERARYSARALVFGTMADKDYASMLASLRPEFDAMIYTECSLPRAAAPEELHAAVPGTCYAQPELALAHARARVGKHGLVVVAGSVFIVAAIRERVLGVRSDPPIPM